VRELNLESKVCFLGKQEDCVPILQRSDLFLLPSENESFGLAALEAMSCGVPVVGASGHGLQEVIRHGETGYLEDIGDVDSMAKDSLKLLNDRTLWDRQSRAARAIVLDKYDLNAVTSVYQDYYYRVLGEPATMS
jgi:glycosyltransferase involved in cell wall biosynthesis